MHLRILFFRCRSALLYFQKSCVVTKPVKSGCRMGRPILKICAKKGCDVTDCTADPARGHEGVDFSVQDCFCRRLDSTSEAEVSDQERLVR